MADTQLAKLAIVISANTAQLAASLKSAQTQLKDFTGGITKIAGAIGLAFSGKAVAEFAFEVARLAGEAEGVQKAFDKFPDSVALMERLKNATSGTVSELDLMKRTVQATNFGISLESLPKLLEFASVRAQQTGQSVDYLVDSIVTGIGRKSPLILDNLGISAVALKEKMGGVAVATASVGEVADAVGKIAVDSLEQMGSIAETTAIKTQRLAASWEDFKVALGGAINQTGIIDKSLSSLTNTLNAIGGDEFTTGLNELKANLGSGSEILERFAAAGGKIDLKWQDLMARGFFRNEEAAKKYEKILAGIQERQKNLKLANQGVDPITGLPTSGGGTPYKKPVSTVPVKTLESLREQLKGLNEDYEALAITDKARLVTTGQEIIALGKQIEELEKLRKASKADKDAVLIDPNTLEGLREKLKGLNEEFDKADKNDRARLTILAEQIAAVETLIDRMERLKKSGDFEFSFQIAPDSKGLFDSDKSEQDIQDRFEDQMKRRAELYKEESERIKKNLQDQKDQAEKTQAQFAQLGSEIIDSFAQSARAGESFGDAMKRVAKTVIATFLARALAAAIAKSFETAKNPIVGAILAGASTAAVFALFNAIPGGRSGGGGGSASVSAGNVQRVQPTSSQTIGFSAEFTIHGNDLKAIANNQANKSGRLG